MSNIKHVGRLINTDRRVVVVFREIPEDKASCLVVDMDGLPDWMHDGLINTVESPAGQATGNFYEVATRSTFSDGSNMLNALHTRGLLKKHATSNVMMTPNSAAKIRLDELNAIIAEQASGESPVQEPVKDPIELARDTASVDQANDVVSDTDLAKNMVAQAEQFEAEAQRLREEAYELEPSLKPRRGRPAKKDTAEVEAE